MRKVLLFSFLLTALGLGACQTIKTVTDAISAVSGVTVTQDNMNASYAAYDIAVLTPYNTYRYSDAKFTTERPYCTTAKPLSLTNQCASFDALSKAQPLLKAVDDGFKTLQARVTGCQVAHDDSACRGISAARDVYVSALKAVDAAKSTFGAK